MPNFILKGYFKMHHLYGTSKQAMTIEDMPAYVGISFLPKDDRRQLDVCNYILERIVTSISTSEMERLSLIESCQLSNMVTEY